MDPRAEIWAPTRDAGRRLLSDVGGGSQFPTHASLALSDASGHEGPVKERGQVRPREPDHCLTQYEPGTAGFLLGWMSLDQVQRRLELRMRGVLHPFVKNGLRVGGGAAQLLQTRHADLMHV